MPVFNPEYRRIDVLASILKEPDERQNFGSREFLDLANQNQN